ncbi:MAG: hypothetical protein D6730_06125 [Bacteroidetes bacterium]|nr:MAG: hypothetical protein D6730_06125 [Bacteroidota bacterium]
MKTITFLLMGVLAMVLTACDCNHLPCLKPDLVVENFEITGSPFVQSGRIHLPVKVVVKNQGSLPADVFKVSVAYTGADGIEYVVAFSVPGESSLWYPFTQGPLAAGASATFEGVLISSFWENGQSIRLRATADSCSGDEFMPEYCRVDECDETNNTSDYIGTTIAIN